MLLISEQFVDSALRFKAPKGMMYDIQTISYTDGSAVSLFVLIFDELLGDEVSDLSTRLSPLSAFRTNTSPAHTVIPGIDHKTKYITITKDAANSVFVFVQIYGNLIKASKLQLLWEYFRSGR